MRRASDPSVRFLYGTPVGRAVLKLIMGLHLDRSMVSFLRSPLSRPLIPGYAKKHGIELSEEELRSFASYRDFFARTRKDLKIDLQPHHLISPCDGWLSVFPIEEDRSFSIKGSHYRLADLLQDEGLAERFCGGNALVFRLCASDYHHYCYIDDGVKGTNHFIPGELHSVQPIVCEKLPVFVLNRRSWTLMETEHFGPVVQTEIGALVVGGIENLQEEASFRKGEEKGRFELAGSTIVLLFEQDRIRLRQDLLRKLEKKSEVRVRIGGCIGFRNVQKKSTL